MGLHLTSCRLKGTTQLRVVSHYFVSMAEHEGAQRWFISICLAQATPALLRGGGAERKAFVSLSYLFSRALLLHPGKSCLKLIQRS